MSLGQLISVPFVAIVVFLLMLPMEWGRPTTRSPNAAAEWASVHKAVADRFIRDRARAEKWAKFDAWWADITTPDHCDYIAHPRGDGSYRLERC